MQINQLPAAASLNLQDKFAVDATDGVTKSITASQLRDLIRTNSYGAPLEASTVTAMTDTSKVYVYTGNETGYTNGNWYYYNGTAWVSGGAYNSVAVNTDTTLTLSGVAADARATGTAIQGVATQVTSVEGDLQQEIDNIFSDLATAYEALTFPVSEGQYCVRAERVYKANQDIPTPEAWNSSHWTLTSLGEGLSDLGDVPGDIATLNAAIVTERLARQTADNTLTGSINTEVAARESADTALSSAITAEATAREAADNDIKSAIINIATPYLINDTYLSAQGITDVRSLPVDRAFIFQNATIANIANMPPITDTNTTGVLISYRGYTDKRYGTSYIYMTSQGLIYTGVDFNTGNIRWKNYAEKSTVDSLTSDIASLQASIVSERLQRQTADTSLNNAISAEATAREQAIAAEASAREASVDEIKSTIINIATPYLINDTYLSAQGITDVLSLPVDRALVFQNVTIANIANMPPITDTNTTGVLISYRGYTDKRYGTSYIYMTSQGLIYTGIDVNAGNIRWKNYAEKSAVDGLTSSVTTLIADAFRTFSVTLTDSWLSDNGVTNARQLQKNRVFIFSNVTKTNITSMPDLPDTVYNGALLYFKQNVNAFSPLLYINNFGECWTGIDTGSEIRWRKTSTESLDDSLSGFHNKKVLILGDSIVYGSHMTDYSPGSRTVITLSDGTSYKNNLSTTVWSAKFIDYIVQNYGVTVVNNAWPGARYQDLVTYYDQIVTDTFDYVIICMGVNNWNSGTSVLTSLRSLKSSFYATATKMIVMTPLGSTTYASQLGVIRDFIKTWGKENSIEIGDLYSTFNFLNYIQGHTLSEVLLDGVHYNDSAQTAIYESVKKVLHL